MIHDETIVTELAGVVAHAGGVAKVRPMSREYDADGDPAWLIIETYKGHRYIAKVWRAKLAGDHRPKKKPRAKAKKKPAVKKRARR